VKLRKNASDSCALPSKTYGGEKKSSVFDQCKWFKEGCMLKSQVKTLIMFFYVRGIVPFEFISQGHTINETYCMEILKQLLEDVYRKRAEQLDSLP
jgi:hypothetical protein